MSQVQIRGIITTALSDWATGKGLTIAREGMAFTKPADNATFLELNIIPADTFTASLDGSRRRYLGEVVVSIWADSTTGSGETEALADELCSVFQPIPKTLLPVSVETYPTIRLSQIVDEGYRVTPVCFLYRAEF